MKTKLFILLSLLTLKANVTEKNNRIKEFLFNVLEEIGAWLLIGAVVMGIFWIVGILFGAPGS